jgi:hypothetical protein
MISCYKENGYEMGQLDSLNMSMRLSIISENISKRINKLI